MITIKSFITLYLIITLIPLLFLWPQLTSGSATMDTTILRWTLIKYHNTFWLDGCRSNNNNLIMKVRIKSQGCRIQHQSQWKLGQDITTHEPIVMSRNKSMSFDVIQQYLFYFFNSALRRGCTYCPLENMCTPAWGYGGGVGGRKLLQPIRTGEPWHWTELW